MQCDDSVIHGYVDGELDLERTLQVEQHLEGCTRCARLMERFQAMRRSLRSDALYHRAPASLQRSIRSTLRRSSRAWALPSPFGWGLAGATAAVCIVAAVLWTLDVRPTAWQRENRLEREVLDSHLQSLLANHLTDVPSSDQHTVKPWFNGRSDYSPAVKDLTAQGFILIGGRLDVIGGRRVPAVVYRRRQHVINLFSWPVSSTPGGQPVSATIQGYNLESWTSGGVEYWAVSDVNRDDLHEFVQLIGN